MVGKNKYWKKHQPVKLSTINHGYAVMPDFRISSRSQWPRPTRLGTMGPELGRKGPAGTRAREFPLCHSVFIFSELYCLIIFCKNISDPNRDPAGAATLMVTWMDPIFIYPKCWHIIFLDHNS
jgi:hypothetical protein